MPTKAERIDALLREALGALARDDDAHAAACAERAAALERRHPATAGLLATLAMRRGDAGTAKQVLERALRWRPDDVWLLTDLAQAEQQLGAVDAALRLRRRCAELAPRAALVHLHLGTALLAAGRPAEAEPPLRRALELEPQLGIAASNLACALSDLGRDDEAEPLLRELLRRQPADAGAALALAAVLRRSARAAEAIELLHGLSTLDAPAPVRAQVRVALGNALAGRDGARSQEAVEAWRTALDLDPLHAGARVNLGQSLVAFGRWVEALDAVAPLVSGPSPPADALDVHALACAGLGLAQQAREAYLTLVRRLDESAAAADAPAAGALAGSHASNRPHAAPRGPEPHGFARTAAFLLHYLPGHDAGATRDEQRRWAERAFAGREPRPRAAYAARLAAPAPRRIGYLSGDFRAHSVSYFIGPVLQGHRSGPFEIWCYSNNREDDARTAQLRARAHHWRDVRDLDDDALAAQIEADRIDVLVDLSGLTLGHRLGVFARRAAPLQATWIGCPGTTGVAAIDWRITDALADPRHDRHADAAHVERLWRLPGCFCCYEPIEDAPEVAAPPSAAGAPLTFGSFNAALKLSEPTLDAWARVLEAVPGSRLLLKFAGGEHASNRDRVRERCAARGIAPARLELAGHAGGQHEHLARYAEIDIALDPFPYNGVTTTLEALWMGVPVVVLAGERHAGRTGLALARAAGLDELVAPDAGAYVRLALRLAGDAGARAVLRATLRERLAASPLLDAAGFTRRLEAAYAGMWERAR